MNNEEAKFILHAYRPDGADAADPGFAEALAHARQDPAIARWFSAQRAFDRAVCAKLDAVTPPPGLRDAILAGAKFDQGNAANMDATAKAGRSRWPGLPTWIGVAASLGVLLAVGLALWPKQAEASPFLLEFALNDTLRQAHHGQHGQEAVDFQALLSSTDTGLADGLTVDFERLRSLGCRVITFDDKPLLEVCFKREGVWFHAYVARVADFPHVAKKLRPTFRDESGASAVAWADAEHIYVVASKAGREALQRLI